jgi:hypothetical protein
VTTYELIDNASLMTVASFEDAEEAFTAWLDTETPQDLILASFDDDGKTLGARSFGRV